MTTLPDRPRTALLVIDVQNGVVADAVDRDGVISRIRGLVENARAAGTPVVWVQQTDENLVPDTPPWELVPELQVGAGEPVVRKRYGDSFEDTDLEAVLAGAKAGRLIVTGAQTDACIRSTLHGAFVRGYDVTLVADAHTTEDLTQWGAPPPEQVIAHTNLYWQYQDGPGRTATVTPAAEVTL
ncbi:cysteine hydrolase family protein [Sporichthya brevicatena]|uniref:Cysteine hydrolase family protein n=1 Tax=Sporichthya brevicatena TaxID=171442 RepID=A0ABN1GFD4_9ACTN